MDLSPELTNYIEIAAAILAATVINIKMVVRHLKPNGGSSLADKIDQLSDRMSNIDSWTLVWMELSPVPIFETDPEGHCTWINSSFSQATGQSLSDMQGLGWLNAVHPDDSDRVKTEWAFAMSTDSAFKSEFRLINQQTKVETRVNAKGLEVARKALGSSHNHGCYIVVMYPKPI